MTTSAKCRPAAWRSRSRRSWTAGSSARDRLAAALPRRPPAPVHEHVDVAADQPRAAAMSTRAATKSAAIESASGQPSRGRDQPHEHGQRPREVAAEVQRVRRAARAARYRRAARSETTVRETSIAITSRRHHERPPGLRRRRVWIKPASGATASPATPITRGRALPPRRAPPGAPPCRGRTGAAVCRTARDADREERQQRGDEVGARVQRLRDEAERAARKARRRA